MITHTDGDISDLSKKKYEGPLKLLIPYYKDLRPAPTAKDTIGLRKRVEQLEKEVEKLKNK